MNILNIKTKSTFLFDHIKVFVMSIVYLGCPPKPTDSLIIGLGISGAVLLVGIILIIFWKIFSFIYDTVEYSRYKADTRDPIWEKVRGF